MQLLLLLSGAIPVTFAFPSPPAGGSSCPPQSTTSTAGVDSTCLLKPNHFTWAPPGPEEVRSPCPALNTLANHGFLPHNGRNVTLDIVKKGLKDAMNIDEQLAAAAFTPALKANPKADSNAIDLDMLYQHNFLEHDGSLSRRDMYFDTSNRFDKDTFDSFLSYFGDAQTINTSSIANARGRHALEMSRINPTFTLPESALQLALGEAALLLTVWGSPTNPIANRSYLEFFFRNERLPVQLGWVPSSTPIDLPTIMQIGNDIKAQTPSDVPLTFKPQSTS
ncbi:putative sterigmatocystin biosynthesis peroxidase stcC 4 [Colletotrichum chlorophyti]|uniref:Putative sterigmatocystin biosynthesis peroxidase stcC 4 n=1 Tax=Colletotrichum chlorophyti TaxID=708187 RepID=A0A1Q8S339_9PEZI|nr:putative sterigmatocystin biosynthesis peroxidase stcC 4 [Colletotrichum chlorophyti]